MAGINSQVVFFQNNYGSNKRRREFISDLAFEILETRLKIRAQINTLPNDIKIFLAKYRNQTQLLTDLDTDKRSGPCHICGGKMCNRTTVRCNNCEKFVCKKHSKHVVTCYNCE